jgi:hypothetical protein
MTVLLSPFRRASQHACSWHFAPCRAAARDLREQGYIYRAEAGAVPGNYDPRQTKVEVTDVGLVDARITAAAAAAASLENDGVIWNLWFSKRLDE